MSSILKALRKLEEEKAALGEGGVDIARDILKRGPAGTQHSSLWRLVVPVLLGALLGAGGLFWFVPRPHSVPQVDVAKTSIPSREQNEIVPTTPTQPISESKPQDQPKIAKPARVEPVPPKKAVEPILIESDGLPFLKLSGIAYRDKAEERIAIINDLPVMQGTSIEGATVVAIHPDSVELEWQGKKFEKHLNKNRD